MRALAPGLLLLFEISRSVRKLLRRIHKPSLHRIHIDILPMLEKAPSISDPHFRKPLLPNFTWIGEFLLRSVGKTALDQLHGSFNTAHVVDRQQQMHVVRHDDKIVDGEFPGADMRAQYINEQRGQAFGLE